MARLTLVLVVLLLGGARAAAGGDATLLRVVETWVPRLNGAGTVQISYDAARELQEGLRLAYPPSAGCLRLYLAAREYANAHVAYAEQVDRIRPLRRATDRTVRAYRRLSATRLRCRPGRAPRYEPPSPLLVPRSGAAFFGIVVDRAARGATVVELYANGRLAATVRRPLANVRFVLRSPPGSYDLEVRQRRGARVVRRAFADDVWLLPSGSRRGRAERSRDEALAARLAALGRGFPGYAGLWVHDLTTGATAGWNSDARFPAASVVKLGVLVAVLARFGDAPRLRHDLAALTGWSSNLAANRLFRLVGGRATVEATLLRLGARSSTYPGDYRIGTAASADAPRQPPPVSLRVTTAHDLGRVLRALQAAAVGNRLAQRITGLDRERARLALGLLLASEPVDDNVGLLRPALGPDVPMALKNGWTSSTRHTAAIVYGPRGPKIVVVLTYRDRLRKADALALGRRVAALLG